MGNSKVKQPVRNGHAKVPVVMQMEALECGAASLCMILAYYNKWIPLEQVRYDCGVSRDGSNARNMLQAARNYGLEAKGFRFEPQFLKENGFFPCIIHWDFNHFVVLCGFKKNKAVINDPARGTVEVSMEEFDRSFTGVTLLLEPGESFEPGGKRKSIREFTKRKLLGTKSAFIFTILIFAATNLMSMVSPAFQRVLYDRLLTGKSPEWVRPFLIILAMVTGLQIVIQALKIIFSLRLEGKLAIVANSEYMWHILRLPMEFFSQRMAGDIAQRKRTNEKIASTLIGTLAPLAVDVFMMLFYLVFLIKTSAVLAMIGVLGVLINAVVRRYISEKRINIARVMMRDSGKLESTTLSGISMIETIKASGAENGFFRKWSGFQASVNRQQVETERINYYLGIIPSLISDIVTMIILWMGVMLIVNGDFTIGILTQFTAWLGSFVAPADQLLDMQNTIREMRTNMERIEDVMDYPVDVTEEKMEFNESLSYKKLGGKIEMKNVTFGYSRLASPLIENFNMTVLPGQKIAFCGPSGCGKSTIAKLLTGLYKPWSGEILYDGIPIDEIDRNQFTGSVAMVDQDITLFEDTISDNIRMWDTTIEDFEVILAARDTMMHETIIQRDGGYQYKMLEGGADFSGGERQRLEIARVLAQDPSIIIMDEATSALDARTEAQVVNSVRDRGISCVVVAHRLSTIRDSDEIIVMNQGQIVERGKHEDLLNEHGFYEQLIMCE